MADFMQWIVKENGIELLRIDDKLRELFTPVELNSCEVKHTIVGIFISMMQVSGVEVSIPKNTLSDDSAIDQRPTVSIKMENGAPAFFVEDEPFKGIDLENQTIDRELLREAIKPYLNANEKDIVELKAGSDVPYAWPAQVIEVVKENGWSVVLLYRTE